MLKAITVEDGFLVVVQQAWLEPAISNALHADEPQDLRERERERERGGEGGGMDGEIR